MEMSTWPLSIWTDARCSGRWRSNVPLPLTRMKTNALIDQVPPIPAPSRLHAQMTSLQCELCSSCIVVNSPKSCSQHASLAEQAVSLDWGWLFFTVGGGGVPCSDLYLILSLILQPLYKVGIIIFSFLNTLCVRPWNLPPIHMWCLRLVLVLGEHWPRRMSWELFPLLLSSERSGIELA